MRCIPSSSYFDLRGSMSDCWRNRTLNIPFLVQDQQLRTLHRVAGTSSRAPMCSSACPPLHTATAWKTAGMEAMKWTVPWRRPPPHLQAPAKSPSSCVLPRAVSCPSCSAMACPTAPAARMKLAAVSSLHGGSYGNVNLPAWTSDALGKKKSNNEVQCKIHHSLAKKPLFVSYSALISEMLEIPN